MAHAESDVEKLRHAYQAWNDTRGGSVQSWMDLLADDVAIRTLGGGNVGLDFGRARRGKAEAEHYFSELGASWEMIHLTPEQFIADGDWVVVLSRCAFRSRHTGKVAESPKADVFRFLDGKIVEFMEFFDTAAAVAASTPD